MKKRSCFFKAEEHLFGQSPCLSSPQTVPKPSLIETISSSKQTLKHLGTCLKVRQAIHTSFDAFPKGALDGANKTLPSHEANSFNESRSHSGRSWNSGQAEAKELEANKGSHGREQTKPLQNIEGHLLSTTENNTEEAFR